jgi:hypothetical protein
MPAQQVFKHIIVLNTIASCNGVIIIVQIIIILRSEAIKTERDYYDENNSSNFNIF